MNTSHSLHTSVSCMRPKRVFEGEAAAQNHQQEASEPLVEEVEYCSIELGLKCGTWGVFITAPMD